MCKKVLVIKESSFSEETKMLKTLGITVIWKRNFREGLEMLENNQFDYIIIGVIFLNRKHRKDNKPYFGKRGGIKFIKENIKLLEEHIKNDRVIIYSWNKDWKDGKKLPSEVAKFLDIKFVDKNNYSTICLEKAIKSALN